MPSTGSAWRARPALSRLVRAAVLGVPLLVSAVAVSSVALLLPDDAVWTWPGLLLLLVLSVVVSVVVERGARRWLPLSVLLQLTMVFPDRAPSRLRLVRAVARSAPPKQLLWTGAASTPVSVQEVVVQLVRALTTHDRRTRGHSERVRVLTELLADEVGLETPARERLRWVALLHDVGKLSVAPRVLNKPAALDAREFTTVKEHPAHGAALAAPLLPWLGEWGLGILDHHERYDGSGYPNGKAGDEISQAGRIICVVDAFETMTSARPYKQAVATRAARAELARCAGSHFDPVYVRAFLAVSLPRVLWAMGPLAFLLQLPFLRSLAEAGARTTHLSPQTAAAVGAAGAAAILSTAGSPGALVGVPPAEAQGPAPATSPSGPAVAAAAEQDLVAAAAPQQPAEAVERRARAQAGSPSVTATTSVPVTPPTAPAAPAAAAPAPVAAAAPAAVAAQPAPQPAPAPAPRADAGSAPAAPAPALLLATEPVAPVQEVLSTAVAVFPLPPGEPMECLLTRSGRIANGQQGVQECTGAAVYWDLEPGTYVFRARPPGASGWSIERTRDIRPAGS